ncbi:hypothetical protein G7074_06430 [Pedobacter sp. HDW13]|uniref:hypothetical protein n=1 Tax=unclassified Pedobacter TaxID=2628915 RepID=UPI000F594BD9|nr:MULTISPECIES: hypothetical protein [unclassified Pedobacter]QIL38949.1 hypothetical protein G7074_06430 [Pedobacter sp. HDW13]RQO72590.1 hypothetical protein DBR40_14880 [Pedobacter sp. KBW01]
MKHNEYEYLLNKIYYNGILKKQGVNADIYQRMQNEYSNLDMKNLVEGKLDSEYAFRKSFLVVRNYVQQAIKDGMKSFQFTMRAGDITKLTYMVDMLNRNFFDKQSLDQIIITANSVFNQYNLKN